MTKNNRVRDERGLIDLDAASHPLARTRIFYLPTAPEQAAEARSGEEPADHATTTESEDPESRATAASAPPRSLEPPARERTIVELPSVVPTRMFELPQMFAGRPADPATTQYFAVEELLSRAGVVRGDATGDATVGAAAATATAVGAPAQRASRAALQVALAGVGRLWARLGVVSRVSLALALLMLFGLSVRSSLLARLQARSHVAASAPAPRVIAPTAPRTPTVVSHVPTSVGSAPPGLERRAVDALAEGRNDAALALYRELAERVPAQRAYAAAVRILESRAKRSER